MKHFIIESKNGVYRRLDSDLCEVSMKTGKMLRYGLSFYNLESLEERGFKIVDEVPKNINFKWGYFKGWDEE